MAKKTTPLVSVIMPVYNAAPYLAETIDSVLRQTFKDFEFLIINDGSQDDSAAIIEQYANRDDRIIAIHQKNKGLVTTLNAAIKKASGTYIARVDADDPSFDDRLERQVDLLNSNQEAVIAGGGFEIIDENGYFIETVHSVTRDEDLRRAMALRNPFGHAGVLFRKDAVLKTGLYSDSHGPTEDYDLWIRLAGIGLLTAVDRPVYKYRIVRSGISQSSSEDQATYTKKHTDNLWKQSLPRVLSRREITIQARRYTSLPVTMAYAVGVKRQFLYDNARLATKLIRYGKPLQGILQLIYIASTGRSGLYEVKNRLLILARLRSS